MWHSVPIVSTERPNNEQCYIRDYVWFLEGVSRVILHSRGLLLIAAQAQEAISQTQVKSTRFRSDKNYGGVVHLESFKLIGSADFERVWK
jgi:hypothetical protein